MTGVHESTDNLGLKRRRFAWAPVRCLTAPRLFISGTDGLWLRFVVETATIGEGCVAYKDDNGRFFPIPDLAMPLAFLIGLAGFTVLVASATSPIVLHACGFPGS